MKDTYHFYVVVIYSDNTEFGFDVYLEGKSHQVLANLQMITRGTLMASNAKYAYAYKEDGFEVCAYQM